MRLSLLTTVAAATAASTTTTPSYTDGRNHNKDLTVSEAPDHLRAYVLPKFHGRGIYLSPTQIIRFSITTNSSDGAFSLIQHTGKVSDWLIARPHTHKLVHEHFYSSRGRSELWAQKDQASPQEAKVAWAGDYGNIPEGTIHTFQLIDPDSQLSHIFHPAGFERLFDAYSLGDFHSTVGAPYLPDPADAQPYGPVTPKEYKKLTGLDVWPVEEKDFLPRRDFINGTAGDVTANWHNGTNVLPAAQDQPYFVANNYGPKFLNTESGYKVIQPLATPEQGNFTVGTVIMSPRLHNETAACATLPHHFALQMDEGHLVLRVDGYKETSLLQGDVAFIPANTGFSYYAKVPFTRFMYMNNGVKGLDYELLKTAKPWGFPSYPIYAGYKP
ncbi:hypothetical protein VHEMI02513 [[Torrubiella] hemipterigena]|uniref:Quercetin 2,3-dioxygenase n=1 Tax=[Torrubiella] hemipterigena TaxID=1531966 RepID=A0A0A1SVZ3_9HYPO|nr:hypothetical protein VHEMI02513 [[Torrubiella] hemipterigena]